MSRIIRKLDKTEIDDALMHLNTKMNVGVAVQTRLAKNFQVYYDILSSWQTALTTQISNLTYFKSYLESLREIPTYVPPDDDDSPGGDDDGGDDEDSGNSTADDGE